MPVMKNAYDAVSKMAKRKKVDHRTAAFLMALREVGKATVMRGI